MDTARVDICYRPLRVAWAIRSDDKAAFRRAVRLTHTLWGGRFNPIVMADRPDEARQIVDLFRADMVVPLGESDEVKGVSALFPHLINPFFGDELFEGRGLDHTRARLLDVQNMLVRWRDVRRLQDLRQAGVRYYICSDDDPLADSLLVLTGDYPDDIGINYGRVVSEAVRAGDFRIDKGVPLPVELLTQPSLGTLSRLGISRHYSIRAGWNYAGFFVGDAANLDDLVTFWNLRAADIQLQFFDPAHAERYSLLRPEYERQTVARLARLDEHHRKLAIWSRTDQREGALKHFEGQPLTACPTDPQILWRGASILPPTMMLGQASSLGVFSHETGKPRVSFALNDKPFAEDTWFHSQHLIASISLWMSDDGYTFRPPYVPEWNDFFSRGMYFHYERLRVEPDRIGVIIDAADHDAFLDGLPASSLMEKLFESAGYNARLSAGGLITRQIIRRVGGLQGARVFKIPGVRRLLKTYGPRDAFTKKAALELIGAKDQTNPGAKFSDHKHLFIEARPTNTDLTPLMVFQYLVEKGLFRIGAELTCPSCNLANWISLDELKQENVCELCGNGFDAARQLVRGVFHYRRTGVLGLEKNTQGAVPVALTLQQLDANLSGFTTGKVHAFSYDLIPSSGNVPSCEVDLVVVVPSLYPGKAEVILGECKDEGGAINATDLENLRRIADTLPRHRFDVYILLSKLAPFTPEEILLARNLYGPDAHRVIMLTARELEPYHMFERTDEEFGVRFHGGSPADLAAATSQIYFQGSAATAAAITSR